MKLNKMQVDEDGVAWTPVKLTRRERHELFKLLKGNFQPLPGCYEHVPAQQLEMIVNEFAQRPPKRWAGANEVSPIKTGIHGNQHFCEAGCGAVIATKDSQHVFVFRQVPRPLYVCEVCKARLDREKAEYEKSHGNEGLKRAAQALEAATPH